MHTLALLLIDVAIVVAAGAFVLLFVVLTQERGNHGDSGDPIG